MRKGEGSPFISSCSDTLTFSNSTQSRLGYTHIFCSPVVITNAHFFLPSLIIGVCQCDFLIQYTAMLRETYLSPDPQSRVQGQALTSAPKKKKKNDNMDLDGGRFWYGWKVPFCLERWSGFIFCNENLVTNIFWHSEMDVSKGLNVIFIHSFL